MGAFVIIAIIAAILAARSAHRSRPAPLPPKIRIERTPPTIGPPSERLPWGSNLRLQLQNSTGGPARWSVELQSARPGVPTRLRVGSAGQAQIQLPKLPDEVVERVIRNANEYLQRVEADRGAIHKSAKGIGWWRQKAVPQP
jgi:hypothetical protein